MEQLPPQVIRHHHHHQREKPFHVVEIDFKGESIEIAAIEFVTAGKRKTVFDPKDVKVKFSLSDPDEEIDEKADFRK